MITLPKKVKTRSGAYGSYFQLSRSRGIKILRGSFRTMTAAYNSDAFDLAKEEAELLRMAESSGVTPKCFGVRIVKRGTVYRVGILMQHLGNKCLADLNVSEEISSEVYDNLISALSHEGIEHNDIHDRNIMYYKGKYYAIDFSPCAIEVLESNA